MSRIALEFTRTSITLSALVAIGSAALTACQDDAPFLAAPPSKASPAKSGTAGKPGTVEQVLFTGLTTDGSADIYIMNADGTNLHRVTSDSTWEQEGAFSPDNKRLVYVRRPTVRNLVEENELWTAYTDGSKQTFIMKMNATISHPRFSPDGSKIVFSAFVSDNDFTEIFVVNADGTGLKRLTYAAGDDARPVWSPDGITIAWVTNRGGKAGIYLMNADGLNPRPLITDCELGCVDPAFSPNGRKIAYVDPMLEVVRVFDLDGEDPTVSVGPLNAGVTQSPTWTKDGTRVVFSSNRGIEGNSELYIGTPGLVQPTDVRRLTVFGPGSALFPVYSN